MIFAWMNARVDVDIERKREERGKGERKKERREEETNSGVLFYGYPKRVNGLTVSVCLSLSLFLSISFFWFLPLSLFFSNLPCLPFAETTKSF